MLPWILSVALLFRLAAPALATWKTRTGEAPSIIGYGGAPFYLPAHSLASYTLALQMGADVVAPGLVLSKDGAIFCSSYIYLSSHTNVGDMAQFVNRKRTHEGREDWWFVDFTEAELKTLRLKQVFSDVRSTASDGLFPPLTLDEYLTNMLSGSTQRNVDFRTLLMLEIKEREYHAQVNLGANRAATYFEDTVLSKLKGYGILCNASLNPASSGPIDLNFKEGELSRNGSIGPAVSATEPASLRYIAALCPELGRVYRVPDDSFLAAPALAEISRFASAVAVDRKLLLLDNPDVSEVVSRIHDAGLDAVVWQRPGATNDPTGPIHRWFQDEQVYCMFLLSQGVDAIYVEKLDDGLAAVRRYGDQSTCRAQQEESKAWCVSMLFLYRVAVIGFFLISCLTLAMCLYHYRTVVHFRAIRKGEEEYIPFGVSRGAPSPR